MRAAQRGQATIDYVALVGVVVLVLAAAVTVAAIGAPGLVNAVTAQTQHALCIVTGRSCTLDRARPCAVATRRDAKHVAVNILIVRGGKDRYILREEMSDGSVRLTVANHVAAGLEIGVGAGLKRESGGRTLGGVDEARAGLELRLGSGKVFVARDVHDADALTHAIRGDRLPAPREVFYDGGLRAVGKVGLSALIAGAWSDVESESVIGARQDRATGSTTIYLNYGGAANALAHVLFSGPAVTGGLRTVLGMRLDRDGKPAELSLSGVLAQEGGSMRPGDQRLDGSRREFSASVALSDPEVRDAWEAFRRRPKSLAAVRSLAERLRARARLDVREYRTASSTHGVNGGVGAVVRVGLESSDTVARAKLTSALTRPPGGLWEPRLDCMAAVA